MDPIKSCLNDFERKMVTDTRNEIDVANLTGSFSDELRASMGSRCLSWKALTDSYYMGRPHPHSDRPPRSGIEVDVGS